MYQWIIPNTQEIKRSISQSSGCFQGFNQEDAFLFLMGFILELYEDNVLKKRRQKNFLNLNISKTKFFI
jgi:hypothetical protein